MRKETLKLKWPYLLPFVGLVLVVLLLALLLPRRAAGQELGSSLGRELVRSFPAAALGSR